MPPLDRLRAVPGWVGARLELLRGTRPFRAYARYSVVRGNVLAGGVAYFAFFSIFPALAIGFTVFALILGNQQDLQAQVVQYINASFGATVIGYHEGQQGVVTIDQLVQPDVLTTTGLIGLVFLILAGLGWIGALRNGIQAMFGARVSTSIVLLKLYDLVLLAAAGLVVLTSVVVSIAVNVATGQVLDLLGIERDPVAGWTVNVLGQLILLALDTVVLTLLFSRLSGVDVPMRDVLGGALLAAIGFTGLKLFASELVRLTSHNRFLAASSLLVGLLIWMNVLARLVLMAAAWSATVAADRGHLRTPDPAAPPGTAVADPPRPRPAPDSASGAGLPAATVGGRSRRPARGLVFAGFLAGALAGRFVARRARREAPSAGAAPSLGPATGRPPAAVPRPSRGEAAHEGAAAHRDGERRDQVDRA